MNNFITSLIRWVVVLVPAVVIFNPDSLYFPFITGKNFLFRGMIEFAFVLYMLLAFIDASFRPKWSAVLKVFGIFVGCMLVADLSAVDATRAIWSNFERMEGFVMIAHLFAYIIMLTSLFRGQKDLEKVVFTTLAVSVFMNLYAILEYIGGATIYQGGVRLDGTLGNSAYLATFMVFSIFYTIFAFVAYGRKNTKILDATIVGSIFYILYYFARLLDSDPNFNFTAHGGV